MKKHKQILARAILPRRQRERGFAAIWGVVLLAFIAAIAGGGYLLSYRQAQFSERVLLDTELRMAAESGVVYFAAQLAADDSARAAALSSATAKKLGEETRGDINTVVYAAADGTGIKLFATASTRRINRYEPTAQGTSGTRAIAYLRDIGGQWQIERWEH